MSMMNLLAGGGSEVAGSLLGGNIHVGLAALGAAIAKLPGRKLTGSGKVESMAVFDRNGEKYDAFFNQFQVSRETK